MTDRRLLEIDYATPPANGDIPTYDSTTSSWLPAAGGGGGGITVEQAQDAIGTILLDTTEIAFVYDDATPNISANLRNGSIDEARLDTSVNASLDLADSALQPNEEGLGFRFENRTSDPGSPTVGQVWLRTDL